MFNPWFILAGVAALVGLFDEVNARTEKPSALPGPKKETKSAPQTIVNVGGTEVKSEGSKAKPKKPSGKVPAEPSGDG